MFFSSLRDCSHRFVGVRSDLSSFGDLGDLAQRTPAKTSAFPVPESRQRKNPNAPRVLLEGGGGLGSYRHDYCYISWHQCMCRVAHSVLEHRLGATSVVTFITKRAALLRSQRSVRSFGGRRLWRGPSASEVASLGWLLGGAACDAGYGLRRTRLPRTRVNKPRRGASGSVRSPSGRRRNHGRGHSLGLPTRLLGDRKGARRSLSCYQGCPPGGCPHRMAGHSRPHPLYSMTAATLSLGGRARVASRH